MKHLTILVDMDDTIESLASAWVDYLNTRHGTTTKLTDITSWDISKAFPTLTNEQVYAPLFEDDFWDWVKPIDGASEVLQKLIADGHKVLIVTTSNYHTLASKMERVLFKYFPFLTWNDVIITSHKQRITIKNMMQKPMECSVWERGLRSIQRLRLLQRRMTLKVGRRCQWKLLCTQQDVQSARF